MDTLRGAFDSGNEADDGDDWGAHEEGSSREIPPEAIGQDERRMQVRAYNHWASLLGDRSFPSIEDLEPHNLHDFGPNSVLLDFSSGIDDPIVQYLGETLGEECGADGPISRLSDVPPRSLLSRITDHYMQILANEAPIGFEAEFVNQRGASILYRGILLPYSSDDETIDFIYGVINWKEMADQVTADELLLEIDQALEAEEPVEDEDKPQKHHADPVTEWADSPLADMEDSAVAEQPVEETHDIDDFDGSLASLVGGTDDGDEDADEPDLPDFSQYRLDDPEADEDEDEDEESPAYSFASLTDYIEPPTKKALVLGSGEFDPADFETPDADAQEPEFSAEEDAAPLAEAQEFDPESPDLSDDLPADAGLHDCLASARELAQNARASEDRSRHALYAAVGRAYDFSLAARAEPQEYEELIEESGLTVQERAPMTPVVKLVFGSDYDKTRLTEYAAVLSHAHRLELARGSLADFLSEAEGGLKGVVKAERRLRREENGKTVEPEDAVRHALAQKLRELDALTIDALAGEGPEFGLVMIRRDGAGKVELIGEVPEDLPLVERAARKLVG
ncbi:hypothetical protein [Erythrobacter sp. JK5]|uniref:PAS domain-containing protein n=1 Tax=Erythrobacter sp. JK5 TaxID=2829500 RepID=UPI001BAD1A90|nr:hypothetical protein [Erythrobacter sp. JK5]QUL37207.1 hypothetical protein KDC96_12580 [Erythrobacter sp. JK5]